MARTVLSHFWFFTLLWYISFPLRCLLIGYDLIALQVEREWDAVPLVTGSLLSLLFWGTVYLGHLTARVRPAGGADGEPLRLPPVWRSAGVVALSVSLALLFVFNTVISGGQYQAFTGNEQNEARVGSGGFFLLAELFVLAAVAYLGRVMQARRRFLLSAGEWALYSLVFLLSVFMTVAINSRRVMAALMLALVVAYGVQSRRRWLLPLAAVLGSVLMSPVLQIIRYLSVTTLLSGESTLGTAFSALTESRVVLTTLSSSFEGIDHLALFVQRAGWSGVLFGIDGGAAWLYNVALAMVPRGVWPGKPLIYGSLAEQHFLYPEMFAASAATTTLPVSFVVDFSYGFGIFGGLILSLLLGRLFAVLSSDLWNPAAGAARRALALFVFVNVFNVVRAGTGFLQAVLVFVLVSGLVLGFRSSFGAALSVALRGLGIDLRARARAPRVTLPAVVSTR